MVSGDSVPSFCADLQQLRRTSGRSAASLAAELSVSRGHFYSIMNGEVRRPPDFSRFVEPFVRACGGDDALVAQWRQRHSALELSYEHQRQQERVAARTAPAPESAHEVAPAEDTPPKKSEYARPPRPWVLWAGAGLMSVLLSVITAVVTTQLSGDDRAEAAAVKALPSSGFCPEPVPPTGQNLLDALPDEQRTQDLKHRPWWSSDASLTRFESLSRYGFDAHIEAGKATFGELIIVRSCLPLSAGQHYRLTFSIRTDKPARVRVRVQENTGEHLPSHEKDLEVGPTPLQYSSIFTGAGNSPEGEVTFQVGGNSSDFELVIEDVRVESVSE